MNQEVSTHRVIYGHLPRRRIVVRVGPVGHTDHAIFHAVVSKDKCIGNAFQELTGFLRIGFFPLFAMYTRLRIAYLLVHALLVLFSLLGSQRLAIEKKGLREIALGGFDNFTISASLIVFAMQTIYPAGVVIVDRF